MKVCCEAKCNAHFNEPGLICPTCREKRLKAIEWKQPTLKVHKTPTPSTERVLLEAMNAPVK